MQDFIECQLKDCIGSEFVGYSISGNGDIMFMFKNEFDIVYKFEFKSPYDGIDINCYKIYKKNMKE